MTHIHLCIVFNEYSFNLSLTADAPKVYAQMMTSCAKIWGPYLDCVMKVCVCVCAYMCMGEWVIASLIVSYNACSPQLRSTYLIGFI